MNKKIKKASRHTNQNEGLIFEKSSPGKRAFELPPLDVPAAEPAKALGALHRKEGIKGFPEVSEIEVIRHFTRLSTWKDRKSTRLNSSHITISYAVFCL